MDNDIMIKKNPNTFSMDGSDFISKNLSNSAIGLYCLINYLFNTLGATADRIYEFSNDSPDEIAEQLAELMQAGLIAY